MPLLRPPSNHPAGEQTSSDSNGSHPPMAMSMMIDSMVHMIQKARSGPTRFDRPEQTDSLVEN